jgi:hypothetical protein
MSKAATEYGTPSASALPSRRSLFGVGASLLLAGAAIATAAHGAQDADAELVRLHQALVAQCDLIDRIEAEGVGADITAASKDQERRLDEAMDRWWVLAEAIVGIPAHTAAGLAAKAATAKIALERVVICGINQTVADIESRETGEIEHRLLWSIAKDLLARGAVA